MNFDAPLVFTAGKISAYALMLIAAAFLGWLLAVLLRAKSRATFAVCAAVLALYVLGTGRAASQKHDALPRTAVANTTENRYDAIVLMIEKRHPPLDPTSRMYSQVSANWVLGRMAQYRSQGSEPIPAMLKAVSDWEAGQP